MGAHGLTFLCYKSTHTAQPDPDVATRLLTRLVARVFSAPSYRLIYSAVVSFLPSSPSPYHLPAVRRTQNWRSGLFCSKRRLSCISSHPSASPSTVKVIIAKIGAENSVPFGPPESDERSERCPTQRHTCMFPMGAPSRVLSVPRCPLVTCLFLVSLLSCNSSLSCCQLCHCVLIFLGAFCAGHDECRVCCSGHIRQHQDV